MSGKHLVAASSKLLPECRQWPKLKQSSSPPMRCLGDYRFERHRPETENKIGTLSRSSADFLTWSPTQALPSFANAHRTSAPRIRCGGTLTGPGLAGTVQSH